MKDPLRRDGSAFRTSQGRRAYAVASRDEPAARTPGAERASDKHALPGDAPGAVLRARLKAARWGGAVSATPCLFAGRLFLDMALRSAQGIADGRATLGGHVKPCDADPFVR